jgi:hypothetical protein
MALMSRRSIAMYSEHAQRQVYSKQIPPQRLCPQSPETRLGNPARVGGLASEPAEQTSCRTSPSD